MSEGKTFSIVQSTLNRTDMSSILTGTVSRKTENAEKNKDNLRALYAKLEELDREGIREYRVDSLMIGSEFLKKLSDDGYTINVIHRGLVCLTW